MFPSGLPLGGPVQVNQSSSLSELLGHNLPSPVCKAQGMATAHISDLSHCKQSYDIKDYSIEADRLVVVELKALINAVLLLQCGEVEATQLERESSWTELDRTPP